MATKDKLVNLEDLKAVYDHGTELLEEKADQTGYYPDLIAGTADNLLSSSYQTDRTPYLLRRTPYGARERGSIVGGSIVWNQLCNAASVTVANGHKYFMKKGAAYSVGASTGTAITGLTSDSDMVIDLTLMFGPTIADYIYTQEQATAGAGVALAKAWAGITADYYPYDAGSIKSVTGLTAHRMTGFNQWDEEWEVGGLNTSGNATAQTDRIRSKNHIPVIAGATYYFKGSVYIWAYDADKVFINRLSYDGIGGTAGVINRTVLIPSGVAYIKFVSYTSYGTTYNNDICINLSDPSKNGTYEPYTAHEYPLDSSLTLRGLLKLDGDSIYYDGDVYPPSGEVKRRYGAVDLGTLTYSYSPSENRLYTIGLSSLIKKQEGSLDLICPLFVATNSLANITNGTNGLMFLSSAGNVSFSKGSYTSADSFKTAMAGVYLVYPLATPTTEQAEPYTELQICDPSGTEEWVGASMPVGHDTKYYEDLKGKIEDIPDAPSADGTYTLKVAVSNGVATYSWG